MPTSSHGAIGKSAIIQCKATHPRIYEHHTTWHTKFSELKKIRTVKYYIQKEMCTILYHERKKYYSIEQSPVEV